MAGDWIKMRVGLVTHPRVIALAENLSYSGDYQDWSGLSGFVPAIGGTKKDFDDEVIQALRVTRYVAVTALLKFWGYANEHAKDEFIANLRIKDIDEIAGVPGFGDAMESIEWAKYDADRAGVVLPNFNEHNASATDRTAADRQKRYRERKKAETSPGDVTGDVTRYDREEKRREEVNTYTLPIGRGGKPDEPVSTSPADGEVQETPPAMPPCPIETIIAAYHEALPECPRLMVRNKTRDGFIRSRWRDFYVEGDFKTQEEGIGVFRWYFAEKVKPSKFLTGRADARNGRDPFVADLEWLMRPTNFAKVIEGKYA